MSPAPTGVIGRCVCTFLAQACHQRHAPRLAGLMVAEDAYIAHLPDRTVHAATAGSQRFTCTIAS